MIEDSNQIENDINFLNSLLKNRQLDELKEKTDLFINKYPEHYVGFFFAAVFSDTPQTVSEPPESTKK